MFKVILGSAIVLVAAVFVNFSFFAERNPIPAHMMGHYLVDRVNFLSPALVQELLAETRRSSPIYSATKEPAVFTTLEDEIGEAVPVNTTPGAAGNKCGTHPLLVLDNTGKRCILPGRIDVGRHYIMTGGAEAKKEPTARLISRVQPFLHYILDYKTNPMTKRMLESPDMIKFAGDVCPKSKPYVDPFQFNFVVQVPGQTVATHIDGVYFRHASRFHVPQWLLAVMKFSGLFEDDFVDQVQVVAYYHTWTDDRAGHFYFWNDAATRKPQVSFPLSGSANSVDGSKVVHAAGVYMPERDPPSLPRTARNTLEYRAGDAAGAHIWDVKSDGAVVQSYGEDELRFSAVYRCRCFKSREDKEQYDEDQKPGKAWTVRQILVKLRADLASRGVLAADAAITPLDLAHLLLATYVSYPLSPTAVVPYNLCAVAELPALSFLRPVVSFFCS